MFSDEVGNIDAYGDDRSPVCCCDSFPPSHLLLSQARKGSRKASSVFYTGRMYGIIVQVGRWVATCNWAQVRVALCVVSTIRSSPWGGSGASPVGGLSTELPRGSPYHPAVTIFSSQLQHIVMRQPSPLGIPRRVAGLTRRGWGCDRGTYFASRYVVSFAIFW